MRCDLVWASHEGAGDPEQIESFEKETGYKLPESYKEVVTKFDNSYVVGRNAFRFYSNLTRDYAVYGIGQFFAYGDTERKSKNIRWVWHHKPEGFPEGLLPFSREGGGNLICFDYRAKPDSEDPPIVVWHQEGRAGTKEEVSPVATTFNELLEMLFEEE